MVPQREGRGGRQVEGSDFGEEVGEVSDEPCRDEVQLLECLVRGLDGEIDARN